MGLYLVAAFFNLCVNCAILLFLILVLYSNVYEGECAGLRWLAQSSVSVILESFLALGVLFASL